MGKQATPTLVRANNALGKARMTPSYGFLNFLYTLISKRVNPHFILRFKNTKQKESGNTEVVKKTVVSGDKWTYERG